MRKPAGFTLIELMVVIAVISILAAVALPILLRSRIAAHEASAIGTLRTINTAQQQYRVQQTTYGDLAGLWAREMVDKVVATGTKAGYTFVLLVSPGGGGYSCRAAPIVPEVSGSRYFFTNSGGVLYVGKDIGVDGSSNPLD